MTKPICSYQESEKLKVLTRRLSNDAGGLGTLSAADALFKYPHDIVHDILLQTNRDKKSKENSNV